MNIGIIGAGKIGSHIADQLLMVDNIKNIHLANRDKIKLKGRLLSLKLKSHYNNNLKCISEFNWRNINYYDLIVICIKDKYDPRTLFLKNEISSGIPKNLRYVGLQLDLPLIKSICLKLKNYSGKIAVITNPVEIVSYYVNKWIPNSFVFGLGVSVDAARLSFVLKEKGFLNIPREEIHLAGEHGNNLIIVSNLMKTIFNKRDLNEKKINRYLKQSMKLGFDIAKFLGFTLQDCTPIFVEDILYILNNKYDNNYHSFSIISKSNACSLPIKFEKIHKYSPYINFTKNEKKSLEKIQIKLMNIISSIDSSILLV